MVRITKRNRRSSKDIRKQSAGGWGLGDALSKEAYYVPEYKSFSDCPDAPRPGALVHVPKPELAQTIMAGGANCAPARLTGSIQVNPRPDLAQTAMAGGGCGCSMKMRGGGCGMKMRGGGCGMKMRGGGCGSSMKMRGGSCGMKMRGGSCGMKMRGGRRNLKSRRTNKKKTRNTMKGGRYFTDISQSIGGDGPNVAPPHTSIACESHRPMPLNPVLPSALTDGPIPDVDVSGLKPAFIQSGGEFHSGHPLSYTAPRAAFAFTPNISQGQKLEPGQIPYQEVVPQTTSCGTLSCGKAIADINKQ